jgi:hypothetical protein
VVAGLRAAGLPEHLDSWRGPSDLPPAVASASLRWRVALGLDARELQVLLDDVAENPEAHAPGYRKAAYQVLGDEAPPGAVDLLLKALERAPSKEDWWEIGKALARIRDPRALPSLVATIVQDDTKDSRYGIGYFALAEWLQVPYEEAHDGRWWERWWAEAGDRLPPEVRGTSLPTLRLRKR